MRVNGGRGARQGSGAVIAVLVTGLLAAACSSAPSALDRSVTTATTKAHGGGPVVTTTTTTAAPKQLEIVAAPWSLANAVSREALVTDGTSMYLAGGLGANNTSSNAVLRIDPTTGTATSAGTLTFAVHDTAGVYRNGEIIVIAGGSPPPRATVQGVTPNGATRTVGQLPGVRTDHAAVLVSGTIFVFAGGDEASALLSSVVSSTDGVSWRTAGQLNQAVRYPALAVANGFVYLIGGVSTLGGTDTKSIQRYDPKTGVTTTVAQLPNALSHANAVTLNGLIYIVGGFVDNKLSAQVLSFDPTANVVASAGQLPAPQSDGAAVVINGTGYIVGGETQGGKETTNVFLIRLH